MILTYGSTTLAESADLTKPPYNLRLPMDQVTDWFRGWKGADAIPLARGNRTRTLTLSVPWLFGSQREADEFYLTHVNDLARSATLTITCGFTGDTSTRAADAVLASAVPTHRGKTIIYDYTFLCGPFTTP